MTVTGVDMNRDGIPEVLQQQQTYMAPAPAVYAAPAPAQTVYAAPAPAVYAQAPAPAVSGGYMTVTGVDMNRDGIPDVLQHQQTYMAPAPAVYAAPSPAYGYAAPAPAVYAAPAPAQAMTVTGVDMNRDGIPDVLQQGAFPAGVPSYAYAAPVPASVSS